MVGIFIWSRCADSARHLLRKCAGSHTRLEDRQARLSGTEPWYLPFALQYGIPSFISDPCGRYFYLVREDWASISVRQSRSLVRIPPKAVSGVLRGNTACLVQQLSPAAKPSHASHTQLPPQQSATLTVEMKNEKREMKNDSSRPRRGDSRITHSFFDTSSVFRFAKSTFPSRGRLFIATRIFVHKLPNKPLNIHPLFIIFQQFLQN